MPLSVYLDERESASLRSAIVFLDGRLAEQDTIEWALRLKPTQRVERMAIDHVLNWAGANIPNEPWKHAWRLIEESWADETVERNGTILFGIRKRLAEGDRSGSLISAIVDLVVPRVKVEAFDTWRWQFIKKPKRPKTFSDLL